MGTRTTNTESIINARHRIEKCLGEAGVASPAAEADLLLESVLKLDRVSLLLCPTRVLSQGEQAKLTKWLARRMKREPLQHILGWAPFFGLELEVTSDTLVPRPETEQLVELSLRRLSDSTRPVVLDVGTGSGAIALAIKLERPDATVVATDISPKALRLARRNANKLGLQINVIAADLLTHPKVTKWAKKARLVVCNPPYLPDGDRELVPPEVKADPDLAVFGGLDGLDVVRRLEHQAQSLLKPGAELLLELDPRNLTVVRDFAKSWEYSQSYEDLAERKRFLLLTR
ncbi:MAG: peptide chain release factor N(5)-glutamine methyltransferase [Deinococcales bacterium]|nr:peptide chain release factor N(5)-glutamine methyltransferase [Deinococcales bacterium]